MRRLSLHDAEQPCMMSTPAHQGQRQVDTPHVQQQWREMLRSVWTRAHRLQRVGGKGLLDGRQLHRLDTCAHHVCQAGPQLTVRMRKQRNSLHGNIRVRF